MGLEKKPYLIDGVTGNGKMLATYGKDGQLHRLWWPRVDYPQHVDRMWMGIDLPGITEEVCWTHGEGWTHRQSYVGESANLLTESLHQRTGVEVTCEDFAVRGEDLLVRDITVTNRSDHPVPVRFFWYSSLTMMENRLYNSVAFDRKGKPSSTSAISMPVPSGRIVPSPGSRREMPWKPPPGES